MKKRIGILFGLLSIFALASCQKKEVDEPIDDVIDERNDLLDRVKTLTNNIGVLPSVDEFYEVEETKSMSNNIVLLNALPEDIDIDYTNPLPEFYENSAYSAFYSSIFENYERLTDLALSVKDNVLSLVTQYDTWVSTGYGVYYYVKYNQITDTLSIKTIDNDMTYEITSSYTLDGKISLYAVMYWNYDIGNSGDPYYNIISFVEDEKWIGVSRNHHIFDNKDDDDYKTIIEVNLKTDEKILVDYQKVINDDYSLEYVSPQIQIENNGFKYICGSDNQNDRISTYDENGNIYFEYVKIKYLDYDASYVTIPLYNLNGWDLAYTTKDGKTYIEIGDNKYEASDWLGVDGYAHTIYYYPQFFFDSAGYNIQPVVRINVENNPNTFEVLKRALNDYGLSYKNNRLDEIEEFVGGFHDALAAKKSDSFENLDTLSPSIYLSAFNKLNTAKYSIKDLSELLDFASKNSIAAEAQTQTSGVYDYIDSKLTGEIIVNDDNTVNLKNVNVEVKKNAILSKTIDYSVALIAECNGDSFELIRSNAFNFDGLNDLSISFKDENVNIIDLLGEDVYSIYVVVLANNTRISNLLTTKLNKDIEINLLTINDSYIDAFGNEVQIETIMKHKIKTTDKCIVSEVVTETA